MKNLKKPNSVKIFFIAIFFVLSAYFMLIRSELYESKTALIVRDMNSASSSSVGVSLFTKANTTQLQDSQVVREYLLSLELFELLDEKFHLTKHYKSDELDIVQRVQWYHHKEDVLEFYRSRLLINYDELSGILHIAFSHTDPKKAQEVLAFMVKQVEYELNEFNRRKAKKQITFIEKEYKENKQKMEASSLKLEEYQNEHLILDPTAIATSSNRIIAEMEAELIKKKIEYSTKKDYLNDDNYEVINLKNEIKEIELSLLNSKKSLTGDNKNRLNKVLFEYEKLKIQFDFDTEVYKNILLQLETLRIDALKEAKTLSVVSKPNLQMDMRIQIKQMLL
jgi:capsular polysaccharide transport system permease protein